MAAMSLTLTAKAFQPEVVETAERQVGVDPGDHGIGGQQQPAAARAADDGRVVADSDRSGAMAGQ